MACWRVLSSALQNSPAAARACPLALSRRPRSGFNPGRAPLRRSLTLTCLLSPGGGIGDSTPDDPLRGVGTPSSSSDSKAQSRRRISRSPSAEALARLSSADSMDGTVFPSRSQSYSSRDGREGLRERPREGEQQQPEGGPESLGPNPNWPYLVALCTLGVVICYADRSNISTAVLPMAQQFGWDKAYQGVVLSVFFGGYATTQILGGKLADQFGGKMVLAAGVALWSLFTAATPAAAAAGTLPLLAARVMLGVGEGVAFPAIHSLISRNVPAANKTTAVGLVTAASYAGTALAFGVSPLIITNFGWQWVFYSFAALALLWLPFWLPVETADKAGRPQPASQEGSASGNGKGTNSGGGADLGALLRRREVWAICAAQYGQSWGMYGLLNWLPTFFSDFYKVELADLGSYTLLPYLAQGALGAATGVLADAMVRRGWAVGTVRRLLQVVGMLGPAACLVLAVSPIVGASASTASNLITLGLGFSALTLGGVSASHLDIAPRNAGLVFGAGNTAATLAGLVSVPVTGYVLQTTGSWPLVFGITAFHYIAGAVAYAAWAGDRPLPEDGGAPVPAPAPGRG